MASGCVPKGGQDLGEEAVKLYLIRFITLRLVYGIRD